MIEPFIIASPYRARVRFAAPLHCHTSVQIRIHGLHRTRSGMGLKFPFFRVRMNLSRK